jgi:hypothetical protein
VVTSIVVEIDDELLEFIHSVASKRHVSLECATLQLLEEERMRSSGTLRGEVSIGAERWTAKMPARGLVYTGYDVEWTRLAADQKAV